MRGDLTNLDVVELSRRFGSTVILHNRGAVGTLRRAATDAGIPTVTLETGEPLRIQDREVRHGVARDPARDEFAVDVSARAAVESTSHRSISSRAGCASTKAAC